MPIIDRVVLLLTKMALHKNEPSNWTHRVQQVGGALAAIKTGVDEGRAVWGAGVAIAPYAAALL